jgi:hypothetical protein
MTHHPYLTITLSTKPLGLEKNRNTTCQYVLSRRQRNPRSKAAADDNVGVEEGTGCSVAAAVAGPVDDGEVHVDAAVGTAQGDSGGAGRESARGSGVKKKGGKKRPSEEVGGTSMEERELTGGENGASKKRKVDGGKMGKGDVKSRLGSGTARAQRGT